MQTTRTNAVENTEHWDSYLASYEEDKPGLMTLRMDLVEQAPIQAFPVALVTGFDFITSREDGLPEEEKLNEIHKASQQLIDFILQKEEGIHVASFMHNQQRQEYFYLRSLGGLEAKMEQFYAESLTGYTCYTNIEKDAVWSLYLEFLYPTDDILNYMYDEKVVAHLEEAGDDLVTFRRVDHWVFFEKPDELEGFSAKAKQQGFHIEGVEEQSPSFQLQVWREDKVELEHIFAVTSGLRKLAQEFRGDYDGWETTVVTG